MKTFDELYDAIDNPELTVHWQQSNYIAFRSNFGEPMVVCTNNNHIVGLYEPDYPPSDFYAVPTKTECNQCDYGKGEVGTVCSHCSRGVIEYKTEVNL